MKRGIDVNGARASSPLGDGFSARAFWLHPLIVGVVPVVNALRQGKNIVGPLDSWPLLLMFFAAGTALLCLFVALYRNPHWGGIAASAVLVAIHCFPLLPEGWWAAAWSVLAVALVSVLFVRRVRVTWLTTLANVFVLVWAFLSLWQLIGQEARMAKPEVTERLNCNHGKIQRAGPQPNIYMLVLDGYGRADVLDEHMQYRSALVDELRDRGFFIATGARAPHSQTALSIGAVFNLDSIDSLNILRDSRNRRPLRKLLKEGAALCLLRAAGYSIVVVPGEFAGSRMPSADERRFAWCVLNEFDYHVIAHTGLPSLLGLLGGSPHAFSHAHRRACLGSQLERFAEPLRPGRSGVLTFAHLVAPHPPFVFQSDGSPRFTRAGTLADNRGFYTTNRIEEDYAKGYQSQVGWVDHEVLRAIDRILEQEEMPIIFVFGDHGPGIQSLKPSELRLRMSVLSAVFGPRELLNEMDPNMGPINTMRRIVAHVTGTQLPLVEERALYSSWSEPFVFEDVTRMLDAEH